MQEEEQEQEEEKEQEEEQSAGARSGPRSGRKSINSPFAYGLTWRLVGGDGGEEGVVPFLNGCG